MVHTDRKLRPNSPSPSCPQHLSPPPSLSYLSVVAVLSLSIFLCIIYTCISPSPFLPPSPSLPDEDGGRRLPLSLPRILYVYYYKHKPLSLFFLCIHYYLRLPPLPHSHMCKLRIPLLSVLFILFSAFDTVSPSPSPSAILHTLRSHYLSLLPLFFVSSPSLLPSPLSFNLNLLLVHNPTNKQVL